MSCIFVLFVFVTWGCHISHSNHNLKVCNSKLHQHCFLGWVASQFLWKMWAPERHRSGLQLSLGRREMWKLSGPGSSWPAPNVPDWCGRRCCGRGWAFCLEPDNWGLVQNTLFINLDQHTFLQQVKKDRLLLVTNRGESLLCICPFRNTLLWIVS